MAFQDGFSAFDGFSSMGGGIASDNYSFLDQSDTELSVKGNGGLRQMHSYVSLQESNNPSLMKLPTDDTQYNTGKINQIDLIIYVILEIIGFYTGYEIYKRFVSK